MDSKLLGDTLIYEIQTNPKEVMSYKVYDN